MINLAEKFRERILQILFAPSLLWGIAMSFHEEIVVLIGLVPGKEAGLLHNVAENALGLVLVTAFLIGVIYLFYRFPLLLVVPESISLWWVVIRLVIYAMVVAVVLALIIGFGWWILIESGHDPNNVQYGMETLTVAVFYSMFLTPVCTVVLVWFSARRVHA